MNRSDICIFGAGAIGLDLGWHCIKAGYSVSFIARGATYKILQTEGLKHLQHLNESIPPTQFQLFESANEAGIYRYVFLTTKVESLLEICSDVYKLLDSESIVISATNGIAPWYSFLQDATIGRFDFPHTPRETFLASIPVRQLLGAVVLRSAKLESPGVIERSSGDSLAIGELNHLPSARVDRICQLLAATGLNAKPSDNIHRDIWLKLIGNIGVSPLSVLSELTIGEMIARPDLRERIKLLMREAELVGLRTGVLRPGEYNEELTFNFMEAKLSKHHPSMFEDFQKGRRSEFHRILEVAELLAKAPGPIEPVEIPEIVRIRHEVKEKLSRR